MDRIVQKILEDYEGEEFFADFVDPKWVEFRDSRCAQPFSAFYGFEVETAHHPYKSRLKAALALRQTAQEDVKNHEKYQDTMDVAERVTWGLFMVLSSGMFRDINEGTFPKLHSRWSDGRSRGKNLGPAIEEHPQYLPIIATLRTKVYGRIERKDWASEATAERAVRYFLRGLGLSRAEAKSLFDAERKQDKRPLTSTPRSRSPSR